VVPRQWRSFLTGSLPVRGRRSEGCPRCCREEARCGLGRCAKCLLRLRRGVWQVLVPWSSRARRATRGHVHETGAACEVIRSGERFAWKVVPRAGTSRLGPHRVVGAWMARGGSPVALVLERVVPTGCRRAGGWRRVVLGTSPARSSAMSCARSVRIGSGRLGFVLARVVPALRRTGGARRRLGSRSFRVRAPCRAKEVDPFCRSEGSRLSRARKVSRSPTRPLQLTRPSVAALPRDLAA
jgi:hypothetical protein